MAMNATKVTLDVKGVNRTGKVFKEIATSAVNVGRTVALIGAAGVGAAAAAFALAARELGRLSDVAMQAGVSTDEITKLSTALNVLGLRTNTPEQIAAAFGKMAKSIGETGLPGFKRAIKAISELATVEERSAAAMAVFGKSGLDFMPIIEAAAKNGTGALEDVISAMPGVSQAAADAGDAVADAMVSMTQGTKALWLEACGVIAKEIDKKFKGGVREAALKGVAYMNYFAQAGVRYVTTWVTSWSEAAGGFQEGLRVAFMNTLKMGGLFVKSFFESVAAPLRKAFEWIADRWVNLWIRITQGEEAAIMHAQVVESMSKTVSEMAMEPWKKLSEDVRALQWFPKGTEVNLDDLKEKLGEEIKKAEKGAAAVSSAAVSFAATDAAGETAEKIEKAMKSVRNELVNGGTYKAATMSLRADYAKGEDKVVKSVNALKGVVEKINATTNKFNNAILGGLGVV